MLKFVITSDQELTIKVRGEAVAKLIPECTLAVNSRRWRMVRSRDCCGDSGIVWVLTYRDTIWDYITFRFGKFIILSCFINPLEETRTVYISTIPDKMELEVELEGSKRTESVPSGQGQGA